jgi:hypothetical protein
MESRPRIRIIFKEQVNFVPINPAAFHYMKKHRLPGWQKLLSLSSRELFEIGVADTVADLVSFLSL